VELPRDCPWCNKAINKKEARNKAYFHEDPKQKYHPWLKKGA
jgi:hypothetical protein